MKDLKSSWFKKPASGTYF